MQLLYFLSLCLIMCFPGFPLTAWSQPKYEFNAVIPPDPGWVFSQVYGINNNRTATGYGRDSAGSKGFIYDGKSYSILLPQNKINAWAYDINDKGTVTGYTSGVWMGDLKGFIYSEGKYIELLPQGWREAYARSINNSGNVAGYGRYKKFYRGFLYSEGKYVELLPQGWQEAFAQGINDGNAVVGWGYDGSGVKKGFLYAGGSYITLLPPEWKEAEAHDINDSGTVTGFGRDRNDVFKGFIYDSGSYTDLLPPGWKWAEAYGINSSGAVVGRGSFDGNTHMRGFLYKDGSYITLLPSNWRWAQAYDINDKWDIAGFGSYGADKTGFIISGVPDISVSPSTIFFSGKINGDSGSLQKAVTVKNEGIGELTIGGVTPPGPPFRIANDNCTGKTLIPSASCTVTYGMSELPAKTFFSHSKIPANDPDENPVEINLGFFPDK